MLTCLRLTSRRWFCRITAIAAAPGYTKQATVAGAAGVRPRHTAVLNEWLATHEHPFWQPDFAQILRSYRVKYVVMEMLGEWEPGLWQEAQAAKEIKPVNCFPAPEGATPWNWPICILEVLPSSSPEINVSLHDGWSGQEDWGVWAEGTQSDAQFVATSRAPVRLEVAAFPLCVPGKNQRVAWRSTARRSPITSGATASRGTQLSTSPSRWCAWV